MLWFFPKTDTKITVGLAKCSQGLHSNLNGSLAGLLSKGGNFVKYNPCKGSIWIPEGL